MKSFILDKDYVLKEKRAWLEVDGFSIRVAKLDEKFFPWSSGLSIKVFKNGEECITPLNEMFVGESELVE
tara:strand:- start:286 stop:495 length:210 start_codon:yes stop_codon:yes gene_type:complete